VFKVKIADTSENLNNILLTDDLTIEKLKIKYNWFLNASVKNCIIGEDSYGLVWYSGEWICGEWENGTWYSGIWHDGFWKNGKFYSYLLDLVMVMSKKFVILEEDKKYSEFRNGKWYQGDFYNGTFSGDRDSTFTSFLDKNTILSKTINCAYFYDGKFHNGLFKNSIWLNGVFYNGNIENSYWCDGKFYNGTFSRYAWFNGYWYGGDFIVGDWYAGYFDQTNNDIKSRFGTYTGTTYKSNWLGGTFSNGEFHSGLNMDSSGNTYPSLNDNLSQWTKGNFNGGKWYGGHFNKGNFNNGEWYGGVFGSTIGSTYYTNCIWNNGKWYNGLWINGTFKNGHFYDGLWLDGVFENGYMSVNTVEGSLLPLSISNVVNLPTVVTYSATTITENSVYGNGRVTNNGGGMILSRGFCYAGSPINPTIGDPTTIIVTDGGTMGPFSIKINGLTQNTTYNYKSFVSNKTGMTYGELYSFTTSQTIIPGLPKVLTYTATTTSDSATLDGFLENNNGQQILSYGFYYKLSTNPLYTQLPPMTLPILSNGTFFSQNIIGALSANTTYNYYAFATNSVGEGIGSPPKPFTTPATSAAVLPILINDSVPDSSITNIKAVGYGYVTYNGNSIITDIGYCWSSTNTLPTVGVDSSASIPVQTGLFSVDMTSLISGTTYYSRAYALNSAGYGYGKTITNLNVITFTTKKLPTVTMISATNP
jgi:hypothetical protein